MACLSTFKVFLLFLAVHLITSTTTTKLSQSSEGYFSTDEMRTTDRSTVMSETATTYEGTKCHLRPVDTELSDKLSEKLQGYTKLVEYRIRFRKMSANDTRNGYYNDDLLTSDDPDGDIFRPQFWTRSTNNQGQTLLALDNNFEMLSLFILSLGIERLDVELTDEPSSCIKNLSVSERISALRNLLLNDFIVSDEDKSGSLGKGEHICNQWVRRNDGTTSFLYICCYISQSGEEICKDIEKSLWVTVLLVSILVIKVLVVLYSPHLIPETYYRDKYTDRNYIHHVEGLTKLRVVKTMNPESYKSQNPPVRMESLKMLPNFKKTVEFMQTDEVQEFHLSKLHLRVKAMELLSDSYVPVSVFRMLKDNILKCRIRNIQVLKSCCDTSIFVLISRGWRVITWFSCLKVLAKLILIGIFALPWIIRLIVYFEYEADLLNDITQATKRLRAHLAFKGSFIHHLSPMHPLFITVYVCVSVVALVYGFMGTALKTQVRLTLRKCLRDMRERSVLDGYAWALRWLLLPLKRVGIFGILIIPIYWPLVFIFILPVLAFSAFPALNLSLKLVVHPFSLICESCSMDRLSVSKMANVKDTFNRKTIGREALFDIKDNLTRKDIFIQSCIILGCLIAFWSVTFLVMECLSFYVEVALYTLIGLIVNASAILRYVTLIFLIIVYTKNTLKGVHELYLAYHKIIRSQLVTSQKDAMLKVAIGEDFEQENTAFRMTVTNDTTPPAEFVVQNGLMSWRIRNLLVFLNNKDKSFTPLKFFFRTIDLDFSGAPGPLWKNTFLAFYSVLKVMVFLFFVVVVVLAFGNEFSTTNQFLAILASGFLPFALRNFFLKGSGPSTVDTSSLRFIKIFEKVVANFSQKWPVADVIEEDSVRVLPQPVRLDSVVDEEDNADKSVEDKVASSDVCVDIETEGSDKRLVVDLIVKVTSAEKMQHLFKSCVSKGDPLQKTTSISSFSNPMFNHE